MQILIHLLVTAPTEQLLLSYWQIFKRCLFKRIIVPVWTSEQFWKAFLLGKFKLKLKCKIKKRNIKFCYLVNIHCIYQCLSNGLLLYITLETTGQISKHSTLAENSFCLIIPDFHLHPTFLFISCYFSGATKYKWDYF